MRQELFLLPELYWPTLGKETPILCATCDSFMSEKDATAMFLREQNTNQKQNAPYASGRLNKTRFRLDWQQRNMGNKCRRNLNFKSAIMNKTMNMQSFCNQFSPVQLIVSFIW